MSGRISEELLFEREDRWRAGEVVQLGPQGLLDQLELDADELTNANYHTERRGFDLFIEVVRQRQPTGWLAWAISDLGPVRQVEVLP